MQTETVPRRDYTSPSLKLLYEPTGEMLTLTEIAKKTGVRGARLRERWTRAGRPRTITTALARPPGAVKERVFVEYPPHGRVCFRQIQQIHRDMGMSLQFFRERWRKAGRPEVVTLATFEHAAMRAIPERTVPVPSDPRYLDDDLWSDDVPFADLCHLSGEVNTGAGRGTIPDDEWLSRRSNVRSSLACMFQARGSGEEQGILVAALERFESALRSELGLGRVTSAGK